MNFLVVFVCFILILGISSFITGAYGLNRGIFYLKKTFNFKFKSKTAKGKIVNYKDNGPYSSGDIIDDVYTYKIIIEYFDEFTNTKRKFSPDVAYNKTICEREYEDVYYYNNGKKTEATTTIYLNLPHGIIFLLIGCFFLPISFVIFYILCSEIF